MFLLPTVWERLGWNFITLTNLKKSEKTISRAILITDGVGERDLGMVTVFCHPNQATIEAYDALSTLHQQDSSVPSMVVVRKYSNTPYIPKGMAHSLYLEVDSLSGGATSTQFPLDRLHLHWLLPVNRTEVLLPHEVREEGLETYPHHPEILWEGLDEKHHLSKPISLSVPLLAPPLQLEENTQTQKGLDCHPASTQTGGGSSST